MATIDRQTVSPQSSNQAYGVATSMQLHPLRLVSPSEMGLPVGAVNRDVTKRAWHDHCQVVADMDRDLKPEGTDSTHTDQAATTDLPIRMSLLYLVSFTVIASPGSVFSYTDEKRTHFYHFSKL